VGELFDVISNSPYSADLKKYMPIPTLKLFVNSELERIKEMIVCPTIITIFDIIGVKVEFCEDIAICDFTYGIPEDEKDLNNSVLPVNWLNIKSDRIIYFKNLYIPENGITETDKIDYIYCSAYYLSGYHEKQFIQDYDVGTPGKK
jgi:hypothetical protein